MSKVMDYIDILKFYGEKKQIDKLAEEQAELQHALLSGTREEILEEIADNLVLMRQFHELYEWPEEMVDAMGDEFKIAAELRGDMEEMIHELIQYQAKLQHELRSRDKFRMYMRSGQVKNLMQIIAKRNDLLPGDVEAKVEEKRMRTSDEIKNLRTKVPGPAPMGLPHCQGPFPRVKPIENRKLSEAATASSGMKMAPEAKKPKSPWGPIGTITISVSPINPGAEPGLDEIAKELGRMLEKEMNEVADSVHRE